MYKKLIVPLDGSDLSEVAIPHAAEIAKSCNVSKVFLVSVTEQIKGTVSRGLVAKETTSAREYHMPPTSQPIPFGTTYPASSGVVYLHDPGAQKEITANVGRMAKTAWTYLSRKSSELEKQGIDAEIRVLVGNPAEEIIRFADEEKADMIIMASRGKSGFNRWEMGNIADKVIRASQVPVLLVKPKQDFKESKPRRRGKST